MVTALVNRLKTEGKTDGPKAHVQLPSDYPPE